ncbi:MAG: hypothetical protein U9R79_00185 [Armatimonadota bacterium]|nr:hypothetical protein [Armatimonadota bacterium]
MASAEERLLTFCRDVYSDHRERHARSQQIALGLLAFNGVLIGILATMVWEVVESGHAADGRCPWLMVMALLLAVIAAGIHVVVATRVTVAWPDPMLLCDRYREYPKVADALFLAEIYAEATSENQPVVDRKFQMIAVANGLTGLAFVSALVALLLLVTG